MTQSGLIPWLSRNRKSLGIALVIVGVGIAVLPTLLASWYGSDFAGTIFTTGLLALLVLGIGVVLAVLPEDAASNPVQLMLLILVLGGVGGLLVALTGIALTSHWWDLLTDWLARDKREGAGKILMSLGVLLAGLAIMVVSLQMGRAEERTNPAVRRLVYGYNAVLTGVLLLLFLVVANVLVGIKFASAIDATSSGQFSISDRTANLIKGLKQPLHIYVIWSTDGGSTQTLQPLKSLLSGLQDRNPQVTVEYLSPTYDREAIIDLRKQYPKKLDHIEIGILLVLGEPKQENATFLRGVELFEADYEGSLTKFKGEDKIAAAITALEGGEKGRTVVYVTQGLGESDLKDASLRNDRGLGVLRERLTSRGGFDIKPLEFNPAAPKIPDDAGIIIVANPKMPAPTAFAQSLREYVVDRKGKAVVLVDLPAELSTMKALPQTGLEGVFAAMNVDVTPNIIYAMQISDAGGGRRVMQDADAIIVGPAESALRLGNPLARAFSSESFVFYGTRMVRPSENPTNPTLNSETLLTTVPGLPVFTETDPTVNPVKVIQQIAGNSAERAKKIAPAPLSVAVVVTEGDPLAAMRGQQTAPPKPRMVVFGDSTFVTNPLVSAQSGTENFSLFASTLDWLAERPTSIGLEPRNFAIYPGIEPQARGVFLFVLPGLLAVIAVVGLGLGVWVVRRR